MNFITRTKEKGIALLIAVILVSIVLTIGLTISVSVFREYVFSSTLRESRAAFYAAEAGSQCARYWLSLNREYFAQNATVLCDDQDVPITAGVDEYTFEYSLDGFPYVADITISELPDMLRVEAEGYNTDPDGAVQNSVQRFVGTEFSESCFKADLSGTGVGVSTAINGNSLQALLNNEGFGFIDIDNDQDNYQQWSIDPNEFSVLQVVSLSRPGAAAFDNAFGWYLDSDLSDITGVGRIKEVSYYTDLPVLNDTTGTPRRFVVPESNNLSFVLMRKLMSGDEIFLATEDALNPGGRKQAVVFEVPYENGGGYVIAFEDRLFNTGSPDGDYDDVVLYMSVTGCKSFPIIQ